ncbi:MAG: trehalase family glycosidase [Pseudomonadota bacterium]|nr:trehalase family glycosidase [Pseudomonadota bacterium]
MEKPIARFLGLTGQLFQANLSNRHPDSPILPTRRAPWDAALVLLFTLIAFYSASSVEGRALAEPDRLNAIESYIDTTWDALTRSNQDLLASLKDPKLGERDRWTLYVAQDVDDRTIEKDLRAKLPEAAMAQIQIRGLPAHVDDIDEHGLLYLPEPYVVPGGRFNEMYGWDSYFILVGLLRDGKTELARFMVDNFVYQVEHYGKILNANRTYYLTRSQPPFLTAMVLGVYEQNGDKEWLVGTLPAIERTYEMWISEPHLTAETGLSRYYDLGSGPAPEVVADERDAEGRTHYDRVREYFKTHDVRAYDEVLYYDSAKDQLTDLFYVGDRSMRESGFDPSNRFGPFNADITFYNPVCLNSLLYRMETDSAQIAHILGREEDAERWRQRAAERKARIDRHLWDDAAGLYLDYRIPDGERRYYPFAATFYPLWVGAASKEQAAGVVANLPLFERPGGLMTSTNRSGSQWDAPFGWAPMQLIAVQGLRRYGYDEAADRISINFLSLVLKEFLEHNVIVEKYDVERRESDVSANIRYGYSENVIGFGWTNAAFVELLAELPQARRELVLRLGGIGTPGD